MARGARGPRWIGWKRAPTGLPRPNRSVTRSGSTAQARSSSSSRPMPSQARAPPRTRDQHLDHADRFHARRRGSNGRARHPAPLRVGRPHRRRAGPHRFLGGAVRRGAPHRQHRAQQLQRRRGPPDPARHPVVPHGRERLERHRLQLRRRPVRAHLGGTRWRRRASRHRGPCRRIQRRQRRHRPARPLRPGDPVIGGPVGHRRRRGLEAGVRERRPQLDAHVHLGRIADASPRTPRSSSTG